MAMERRVRQPPEALECLNCHLHRLQGFVLGLIGLHNLEDLGPIGVLGLYAPSLSRGFARIESKSAAHDKPSTASFDLRSFTTPYVDFIPPDALAYKTQLLQLFDC